ncbi:CDGSH iron-sulfur domain-containing protein [Amycolatopsis sp. NPDC026612]|uniref:CDGSH iron-sulfur domain-containing protein n=1 Tax=Amycolatopsis sp. NPDC026612 TaxID=3155466 RepID=UPI0033F7D840
MAVQQENEPAVVIKIVDNGPYQVKGPIKVVDHVGNEYQLTGRTQLLCRCGRSANKPFCAAHTPEPNSRRQVVCCSLHGASRLAPRASRLAQ